MIPPSGRYRSRLEWLRARRIGSSDVPALLGRSRWATPYDVWDRLVHGVHDEGGPSTPEQDRGIRLEPQIVATYAARTGARVERVPPYTLWSRDEWATATPDAVRLDDERIVEAKTDRDPSRWGPEQPLDRWVEGAEKVVRPEYYLQVQHQLWVCDVQRADLAVLLPGDDPLLPELRVYEIARDEVVVERLVERLVAWYRRHVLTRDPPELDDSAAATRALAAVERSETRRATAREAQLAAAYLAAAEQEKAAREAKKRASRELVISAGTARQLELPVGRVSIVAGQSAPQLDEGALLAEHPHLEPLLARYRRPGIAFTYPRVAGYRGAR